MGGLRQHMLASAAAGGAAYGGPVRMSHADKRAIILCATRDSAPFLRDALANIQNISGLFSEAVIAVFENDSRDSTKALLNTWAEGNRRARIFNLDGLAAQQTLRTVRLASVRNLAIAYAKEQFRDFDYVLFFDADDVSAFQVSSESMRKSLAFLDGDQKCAGVFANQEGCYYDLWALRHGVLCPGDIWEDVADYALAHHSPDQVAFDRMFRPRILNISADDSPISVTSAFGGLGIYKMGSVLRNRRQYVGQKLKFVSLLDGKKECFGWQVCDHVAFNEGFIENGETLHILPWLINGVIKNKTFPAGAWKTMLFRIGRNQLCPCNSGKRYKRCHGALT
jgi:hypothetical protein